MNQLNSTEIFEWVDNPWGSDDAVGKFFRHAQYVHYIFMNQQPPPYCKQIEAFIIKWIK